MAQTCWGDPYDYYHRDIDNGTPDCGIALDISEDIIYIGDTNDSKSLPVDVPECPDCLWLDDNPDQTNLFG